MSQHISINLNQLQKQKQMQHLMMSPQMQHALALLQMPIMELSSVIELELQQNPIVELIENLGEEIGSEHLDRELNFDESDLNRLRNLEEAHHEHFALSEGGYSKRSEEEDRLKNFLDSNVQKELSLNEVLMQQAAQTFDNQSDRDCAELIIGHLDEKGFLTTPLQEIASQYHKELNQLRKVLIQIQDFEPYGIGAENIQESLLIQLRCLGKEKGLAYTIVAKHYNDLIHNRIPLISKSLKCDQKSILKEIDQHIAPLDLRPGLQHSKKATQYIIPDVVLRVEGENIHVDVESDILPPIRVNRAYMNMLEDDKVPLEDKNFIKNHLMSIKWLMRNIQHRQTIIERIAHSLVKRQRDFFLHEKGKLIPLKMKTLAEELEVHESTIARAVANKYLDTPYGIMPFRSFFSHAYTTEEGEDISSVTVQALLKELIVQEDKRKPLSDAALSSLLGKQGIVCARRTVAKYRTEMNIGNAKQRKNHSV